jgi:hypothetical protein
MANGKIVYYYGGSQITYIFPTNFSLGSELGYRDTGSLERAADGTGAYANPYPKQMAKLAFKYIKTDQKTILEQAFQGSLPLDFYWDSAGGKTFTGLFLSPPDFKEVLDGYFDGDVELGEI